MASKPSFADVAVFAALPNLLTYRIPEDFEKIARPGRRVLVPLANRKTRGIIVRCGGPPHASVTAREILQVVDPEAVLSEDLLELGNWISNYYFAPPGEVFQAMLPLRVETQQRRYLYLTLKGSKRLDDLRLRLLRDAEEVLEGQVLEALADSPGMEAGRLRRRLKVLNAPLLARWIERGLLEVRREEVVRHKRELTLIRLLDSDITPTRRLSPAARRILDLLRQYQAPMSQADLLKAARAKTAHLKKMELEGLLSILQEPLEWVGSDDKPEIFPSIERLTPAQEDILRKIQDRLAENQFRVLLLHGVTGSGKTEVYLRSIASVLEKGRGALVLVPEIALTPSLEHLFSARFPGKVALLHSGLRDRERQEKWWRVRRGEARLVLGTRSAVLAPVADLGLVVVDEEHDPSYKQQETPRYHGRDVAIVRARRAGTVVLLGSATPALESYWNARQKKYELLELRERVEGRPLAKVEILDMRKEFKVTHKSTPISETLREELRVQLERNSQAMILVNRRGYSWFLLCRKCGQSECCQNCSVTLTYHRRERCLKCHYCGYTRSVPDLCGACGSEYLTFVGAGTEKVVELLGSIFPAARIGRLDRDVAHRSGEFRRVLGQFRKGELNLLVGTQIIAKGHDFPGVTLVGVIASDAGLALPDFRAGERVFQLLTQSAGRAGRGPEPGKVLIQTFYPDHYAIQTAARQDYAAFYEKEIRFRRMMNYPPLTALANILVRHRNLKKASALASKLGEFLERICQKNSGLRLLGPGPAPLARLQSQFRIHFLIKAKNRQILNGALAQIPPFCLSERMPGNSLVIDVDPVSLM